MYPLLAALWPYLQAIGGGIGSAGSALGGGLTSIGSMIGSGLGSAGSTLASMLPKAGLTAVEQGAATAGTASQLPTSYLLKNALLGKNWGEAAKIGASSLGNVVGGQSLGNAIYSPSSTNLGSLVKDMGGTMMANLSSGGTTEPPQQPAAPRTINIKKQSLVADENINDPILKRMLSNLNAQSTASRYPRKMSSI